MGDAVRTGPNQEDAMAPGSPPRPGTARTTPEAAHALAARLLGDLRTTLGGPQIAHARRVAEAVHDPDDGIVATAAFLHDVLEHGGIAADELTALTGDPELVRLVELVSQRTDESDHDYLARCASDRRALLIKRADLTDKLVA